MNRTVLVCATALLSSWVAYCCHAQEVTDTLPAAELKPKANTKVESGKSGEEEPPVETSRKPSVPLGPRYIRLHLLDGSIIGGDLTVEAIEVKTPFGELVVPIAKIRSFKPGLDSYPKQAQELAEKIRNLGSDDYQTREQAHKDLAAMGAKVRSELKKHANDENAEIKRHVGEILKELEEAAEQYEDEEEDGANADAAWIHEDTVVTTDFTVTGKVSPTEFKIQSKYGPLSVQLEDIRLAEREVDEKGDLRRTITVSGANLAQRGFKSTGIRVQPGDRITVKAEGNLVMSPWGSNSMSTPDGGQNFGWYIPNQIPGGCLVAKIGEKGTVMKVGRQASFTAKSAGTLQFAIGMQGEYANQGYNFPGEYRLKLKIEPK